MQTKTGLSTELDRTLEKIAASGEIYSVFKRISPEKAQQILNIQPRNRKIIRAKVAEYARTMLQGSWNETNPQGLIFNKKGELINGQHRLYAVIESGATVQFYCTFNADDAVKTLLDSGSSRRIDQTGQILGLDTNPVKIAIAKALIISPADTKISRPRLSAEETLRIYQDYSRGIDLAAVRTSSNSIGSSISRAVVARAYYHTDDPERLSHFLHVLDTGFPETAEDSCAIALRNLHLASKARQSSSSRCKLTIYRKTLCALHGYLERKDVKSLVEIKTQLFPLAIDEPLLTL